jgi:hypothetical protein
MAFLAWKCRKGTRYSPRMIVVYYYVITSRIRDCGDGRIDGPIEVCLTPMGRSIEVWTTWPGNRWIDKSSDEQADLFPSMRISLPKGYWQWDSEWVGILVSEISLLREKLAMFAVLTVECRTEPRNIIKKCWLLRLTIIDWYWRLWGYWWLKLRKIKNSSLSDDLDKIKSLSSCDIFWKIIFFEWVQVYRF